MSEEALMNLLSTLYDISLYFGIVGFILLIVSFLTGLRYIKPKPKYKIHRRIGIIGTILMSYHALFMLFWKYILPIIMS